MIVLIDYGDKEYYVRADVYLYYLHISILSYPHCIICISTDSCSTYFRKTFFLVTSFILKTLLIMMKISVVYLTTK